MDARSFNGPDERELSAPLAEDEDRCRYCDILPTEPHHPACPLYLPICACGRVARRHVAGQPVCSKCVTRG